MMDHIEMTLMVIIVLTLCWYLQMIVQHMIDMQALALNGEWEPMGALHTVVLHMCEQSLLPLYYM